MLQHGINTEVSHYDLTVLEKLLLTHPNRYVMQNGKPLCRGKTFLSLSDRGVQTRREILCS